MERNTEVVAAAIVIISMMMAIGGYGFIMILDGIQGNDPLFHEDSYETKGEVNGIAVHGTGESKFSKENDDLLVYDFYIGTKNEALPDYHAVLLCDKEGNPTEDYDNLGVRDGLNVWCYEQDGIVFEFYIGESALVEKLETTGENCHLSSVLIQ